MSVPRIRAKYFYAQLFLNRNIRKMLWASSKQEIDIFYKTFCDRRKLVQYKRGECWPLVFSHSSISTLLI